VWRPSFFVEYQAINNNLLKPTEFLIGKGIFGSGKAVSARITRDSYKDCPGETPVEEAA